MIELSELIKLTLKNLSKKNLYATPENYEKEFFALAKENSFHNSELDRFEKLLDSIKNSDLNDIEANSYKDLSTILSNRINNDELKYFLQHLSYLMSPSLNKEIKEDIDNVCAKLLDSPKDLVTTNTLRKLRSLANSRIKGDIKVYKDKNEDLKKLMEFLSSYLKRRIDSNRLSLDEIGKVKSEINSLEFSSSSKQEFASFCEKLNGIVDNFSSIVDNKNNELEDTTQESEKLYEQIEELKSDLSKAQEEKSIDYLTKVLTRRALDMAIEKAERDYKTFKTKYAIVFLDLDHFKVVNDTYGHSCGDSVLATFGSILNKLTRNEDVIGRYGGEEFICILHYKNLMEISNYLKRIKNIVANSKFVYENIKLDIRFSGGVALRNRYNSYEETLAKADELVYKAKNTGRDKIITDSEEVI